MADDPAQAGDAATTPTEISVTPGYRLKMIEGRYSIRVNDQFRITFRFENRDAFDVLCEDYHCEGAMAKNTKTSAAPIHPGEILLEEFLKQYDPPVSQVEAAERMHMPKVRLNQLVRGHRGVTPDTALRLADLTGTSAEFWMNLQCRYDLWQAQQERAERKEPKIRSLAKAS